MLMAGVMEMERRGGREREAQRSDYMHGQPDVLLVRVDVDQQAIPGAARPHPQLQCQHMRRRGERQGYLHVRPPPERHRLRGHRAAEAGPAGIALALGLLQAAHAAPTAPAPWNSAQTRLLLGPAAAHTALAGGWLAQVDQLQRSYETVTCPIDL